MLRLRTQLLAFLLAWSCEVLADTNNNPAGARSAGMAHSTVAVSSVWSSFHNQAGLGRIEKFRAGVFYENRYNISELGLKAATLAIPSNFGSWSFCYSQYGYNLYKESKIGLAYARPLGKHIWAGIQMDYFRIALQHQYGRKNCCTFEAGLQARLIPELFIGFHVFNPIQAEFSTRDYKEPLPARARLGIAWHLSDEFLFTLETEKDLEASERMKGGLEYQVLEKFHIRVGVANHPRTFSFGIGISIKPITTNIAFTRHPVLGNSPSISLNLEP
ncbi:MAG: hypothetical protein ACEPOZ_05585 [Marinifilaceae bacterium]